MQRQIKKKQRHNFKVEPIFEQMSSYQLNAMEDDSDNQFTKATLFNSAKNIMFSVENKNYRLCCNGLQCDHFNRDHWGQWKLVIAYCRAE